MYKRDEISSLTQSQKKKKKKIQKFLLQDKWYKNPPSSDTTHPQISKRNTNEHAPLSQATKENRSESGKLSGTDWKQRA